MAVDIGIDLGTTSIVVYLRGRGIVLKEPSIVAFERETEQIKEIGAEARIMLGQSHGNLVAVRPLKQGVITDYSVTERIIRYFVQKSLGKLALKKPRMAISVPCSATEVERKAVETAAYAAGAREVFIVEEPMAAALGAGIDIEKPSANLIVDIGGGTTDVALLSLGSPVAKAFVKVAGNDFDEALIRYMRARHQLLIGETVAEDIKIQIGTVHSEIWEPSMEVKGRDLFDGLPKTIVLSSNETAVALKDVTEQIIQVVCKVLEETPPELAADLLERGILLTGGGSLIRGLARLIEDRTGVRATLVQDPLMAVAKGVGSYAHRV